eukprot:TRINITY_DN697_c2_g1_i1.p1 TRINITY_DN697_c2_g1~~TRINITY_DN697_c2_g1_i1.p1  ORF type:complete len:534 (-),score=133.60 TRINITY_DN697_c2_g1_i1:106-1707(-)
MASSSYMQIERLKINKSLINSSLKTENNLLNVPAERLNKFCRQIQRQLERELINVINQIQTLQKQHQKKDITSFELKIQFDKTVKKVSILRTKLDELKNIEEGYLNTINDRIQYLNNINKSVFDTKEIKQDNKKVSFMKDDDESDSENEAELEEDSLFDEDFFHTNYNKVNDVIDKYLNIKFDRILVDFLMREGYLKTAKLLIADSDIKNLVDFDLFEKRKKIIDSLKKKNCKLALKWCAENRTRLKKIKSNLEFNIRIQEFINLIKKNKRNEAIKYSRKFFHSFLKSDNDSNNSSKISSSSSSSFDNVNPYMKKIQRVMACLILPPDTQCSPYKELFDDDQWDMLIKQFLRDCNSVQCFTKNSLLDIYLQNGIPAIKTLQCCKYNKNKDYNSSFFSNNNNNVDEESDEENKDKDADMEDIQDVQKGSKRKKSNKVDEFNEENYNINCPTCQPLFVKLSKDLPCSRHLNSTLVCRISNEIMDEDNPPMVFPNGHIYSYNALKRMADANDNNVVTCPKTNEKCLFSDLRKAYIS